MPRAIDMPLGGAAMPANMGGPQSPTQTCANCRHWRRASWFSHNTEKCLEHVQRADGTLTAVGIKSDDSEDQRFGLCLHPSMRSDCGDSWIYGGDNPLPADHDDGVRAECDETRAWLHTGQNFGCIHFYPK